MGYTYIILKINRAVLTTPEYTHQYSVKDKQTLFVLLKYIIVAMTATKVSNSVWSSENKSNDVTTTPIVHDSITV